MYKYWQSCNANACEVLLTMMRRWWFSLGNTCACICLCTYACVRYVMKFNVYCTISKQKNMN